MAFTNNESLDDNNIRKRNGDWVVIIDEENAIIENKSGSSSVSIDDIESNKKEPCSIEIDRRSHSPVYNFNTNDFDDSVCDFLKNINLDKVLECLLVPISNIIFFLQENIEVNENNNSLQLI
jgi:hypothetical protein